MFALCATSLVAVLLLLVLCVPLCWLGRCAEANREKEKEP
jgi:hypothetical protein